MQVDRPYGACRIFTVGADSSMAEKSEWKGSDALPLISRRAFGGALRHSGSGLADLALLLFALCGLRIDVLGQLGELLIRLFLFFQRLFDQGNMLFLTQQFRKGSNCSISGDFIVFHSLSSTNNCGIHKGFAVL